MYFEFVVPGLPAFEALHLSVWAYWIVVLVLVVKRVVVIVLVV